MWQSRRIRGTPWDHVTWWQVTDKGVDWQGMSWEINGGQKMKNGAQDRNILLIFLKTLQSLFEAFSLVLLLISQTLA